MPNPNPALNDPSAVRTRIRIIWAAFVGGCVTITIALLVASQSQIGAPTSSSQPPATVFLLIEAILTLIGIPTAFITRGQIFKRGWVGDVVTPQYYTLGVIVSCAICEGIYIMSLMFAFVLHFPMKLCIAPPINFIALLLLFPNGKAMFPLQPRNNNPYEFKR